MWNYLCDLVGRAVHARARCMRAVGVAAATALCVSVSAQQAPPPAPQAAASALEQRIAAVGRRGFLFEATRGAQRFFLYGACQACKPEYLPLNPPLMQALAASTRLMVDVNYLAQPASLQAEVYALAALPGDETLESHVDAEAVHRLRQVLPTLGIPYENLQKTAPWMVGLILASQHLSRQGYLLNQNTMLYLLGYAKGRQLPVVELEGALAPMQQFAAAPADVKADFLDRMVRDIASGRLLKKQQLLVEQGWAVGQSSNVQKFNVIEEASAGPWAAYYRSHVLEKRNREWVAQIERSATEAPAMVALQAPRLFGPAGVVAMLQERGFVLRDLQGLAQ